MNRRNQVIKDNIRNGGTTAPKNPNTKKQGIGQGYNPKVGLGQAKQPRAYAPGPSRPAPAAPPQQTPMPWDVQASNDEAAALRRRSNTIAGLDSGWLRTQQDYGLEGAWADAKSNPYSQASLLQRKATQAQQGTLNSYASQGHLYSGALVRGRESNNFAFDQSRDALAKQYAGLGAQYQGERVGADDAYREAQNEAQWRRINAGLSVPPDATAAAAEAKKKKKKKKQGNDRIKQNISQGKALS